MNTIENKNIVVAGGTGNVGSLIVRRLIEHGATVAVPSRSPAKADDLREYLSHHLDNSQLARIQTFVGDIGDGARTSELVEEICERMGSIHGAVSTLGRWHSVRSVLSATKQDFEPVLDGYLYSHLGVARRLVPVLEETGGTYVFINGPLAFRPWGSESALVSIVTAAQHMLFQSLAKELGGGSVKLAEVVTYAFIRDRTTQPGSPLQGEDVGDFIAALMAGSNPEVHGKSIHLRSADQVSRMLKEAVG